MPHRLIKPLLSWQNQHGRHNLPWQNTSDPYRIWLSEIMLQQTGAGTVVDYYLRFLARFPSLHDLAKSTIDEVLQQWAGLGYYRRAHLLHSCAKELQEKYAQKKHQRWLINYPQSVDAWLALPGIGRTSAGSIVSAAFNLPEPILDGNVKRVLGRAILGLPHPTNKTLSRSQEQELWTLSRQLIHTPPAKNHARQWNQALMDLGATLCTKQPQCTQCPWKSHCAAHTQGEFNPQKTTVTKKNTRIISEKIALEPLSLLIFYRQVAKGAAPLIYLEKRLPTGLWAGMWCLPMVSVHSLAPSIPSIRPQNWRALPAFTHRLTHRHFAVTPLLITLPYKAQEAERLIAPCLESMERLAHNARNVSTVSIERSINVERAHQWVDLPAALSLGLPRLAQKALQSVGDIQV